MAIEINRLSKAGDLPDQWDSLAVDYFQTKEFLVHAEKYNPCKQRYYTLYKDGTFEAGAIVYTLRLDLFTYLSIPSPFRMNIAGIPCSVSSSGIIGSFELFSDLIEHIKKQENSELILEQALKEGMFTLKQDGILKVIQGITDMAEVRRVCIT